MTRKIETITKDGVIDSYDRSSAAGILKVEDKSLNFSLTCFVSGRQVREPKEGENVTVFFGGSDVSEEQLLCVSVKEWR